MNNDLCNNFEYFKAGNISNCFDQWEYITSDFEILESVSGLKLDTKGLASLKGSFTSRTSAETAAIISSEISKLITNGVVEPTFHEAEEIISPIFLRPKADNQHRMILNLKNLNSTTEKLHFKMETISSILKMVRPNVYFTKVDIRDAYYSVPIFDLHKKYLKFEHLDELFQFRVLPNGYCHGPRRFTKLLKPPLSILREEGVIIAPYFDDFLNMHRNEDTCFQNTGKIVDLFQTLGFVVHPSPKSSLSPSQTIEFLGFIINSGKMQVTLTSEKK